MPDLLGAPPHAEVTNASTTGLLDVRTRTWSQEVLDVASRLAGREIAPLLAPLVEPGTVVGELDPGAAGRVTGAHEADGLEAAAGARLVAVGQPAPRDPGEVTRCILDSLAAAYRTAIEGLAAAADREIRTVHVVGGGARNALLCRLTADATGLPVVAGPAEGAALGNLLVQLAALGEVPAEPGALRELARRSTTTVRYEPG